MNPFSMVASVAESSLPTGVFGAGSVSHLQVVPSILLLVNAILVVVFVVVMRQRNLLGFAKGGKWYLTWLATGVITLMDELTSVFYAPAEAHRIIGSKAIFFIAFTSLVMRVLSSRMVEIGQILEQNNLRGGGVYSFSYLVMGPAVSFVAVASIMVDYILTACISTVSAVNNGTAFVSIGPVTEQGLVLAIIWGVAILNIVGIRENARVVFGIFVAAAFVFVNLIVLGVVHIGPQSSHVMLESVTSVAADVTHANIAHVIQVITVGVASCVLAYSGIESVLQTAGLVEGWRDVGRAYWFLALTVGLVTPIVSALSLSANIDVAAHEGDLIPYWAAQVSSDTFGVVVGLFGSVILIMAVNTAYVASSELLERVAHRYDFGWLIATNRRASLYRIHIVNGLLYTGIILLTSGSQMVLAEMYAIGLLASFCINMGCLLVYRYFRGTASIRAYYTSRVGTLLLEVLLVACFIYLAFHKPYGTALWASVVGVLLLAGLPFSRRFGPEVQQVRRSDFPMEMILALAEADGDLNIHFRRPGELERAVSESGAVFVTFFSPRQPMPQRAAENHFRFPIQAGGVYRSMVAILALVDEEFAGRAVRVHLGWPMSSWWDRISTGIFVANLTRLPTKFRDLQFLIEYPPPGGHQPAGVA